MGSALDKANTMLQSFPMLTVKGGLKQPLPTSLGLSFGGVGGRQRWQVRNYSYTFMSKFCRSVATNGYEQVTSIYEYFFIKVGSNEECELLAWGIWHLMRPFKSCLSDEDRVWIYLFTLKLQAMPIDSEGGINSRKTWAWCRLLFF